MAPDDLDSAELAALRRAAAALAGQDGRGVPRRALVDLAGARHDVTLLRGDPPLALVRPRPDAALAGLTRREREVAALVAAGRTNAQIAGELVLSVATVKDHVHRILSKSGLPNRAALAAAWRSG